VNRPGAVTFVGVAGLILGCYALAQSAQGILTPWMLEFQERFLERVATQGSRGTDPSEPTPNPADVFREFMWAPPSWFKQWSVGIGIVGLACSAAYILGSAWLLLLHRRAVPVLACACVGSIIVGVARTAMFLCAGGFMGVTALPGNIVGFVLDFVFLTILLTVGRRALTTRPQILEPPPIE